MKSTIWVKFKKKMANGEFRRYLWINFKSEYPIKKSGGWRTSTFKKSKALHALWNVHIKIMCISCSKNIKQVTRIPIYFYFSCALSRSVIFRVRCKNILPALQWGSKLHTRPVFKLWTSVGYSNCKLFK